MLPQEIPLEEVREGLTPETYILIKNCLWRQEWNRYETIPKMLNALDAAISAEQTRPQTEGISRNKRAWLLYGGIAFSLLAIAAVVAFFLIK